MQATHFSGKDYERYKNIFKNQRLPLAFVDLEKFDRNIEYVASTQNHTHKKIRIHTKSIRCAPLTRRILEVGGSAFQGIMTYTMEETAFLADQGFDDFIVAYPTVQATDINLFIQLTRAGKKVSLVIDSAEQLRMISAAAEKADTLLHTCLEIDLSYRPLGTPIHLGLRRSPIRSEGSALKVAKEAHGLPGVVIDAIMGYEAHISGPNDDLPNDAAKNRAIRAIKLRSVRELTARRGKVVGALRAMGLGIDTVNGGGSGSLRSTGTDPVVTEVTAGSAFFAPGLFWYFKDVNFTPAVFFALQVVRRPAANMVTCHGGGYPASGSAGPDKLPRPVLPAGLRLLPLEGGGEVQTPLTLPRGGKPLSLGDPVFFQHAKAGELTERFNHLYLIKGNKIMDKVKTYRGEQKAFL